MCGLCEVRVACVCVWVPLQRTSPCTLHVLRHIIFPLSAARRLPASAPTHVQGRPLPAGPELGAEVRLEADTHTLSCPLQQKVLFTSLQCICKQAAPV